MLLDNGITFAEKLRPFTNTVTFNILFKGGRRTETAETMGIGNLFAGVLLKSSHILEKSEANGFEVYVDTYLNFFKLGFSAPTYMAKDVLKDFQEFILSCTLLQDKFLLEQQQCLADIERAKDSPEYQANIRFLRLKYGDTPLGWSALGTAETIENLTLPHLQDYCTSNLKAGAAAAAIVGNYDNSFKEAVLTMLSKLPQGTPHIHDYIIESRNEDVRVEESYERIVQSNLIMGYDAPDRFSKQYIPSKILTSLLGGGMSSRYFERIRKELGYAYFVTNQYSSIQGSSYYAIYAALDYKNADSAIDAVNDINKNLKTTLTQEELEKAKNAVLGRALIDAQTNYSVATKMTSCMISGLEPDFMDNALEKTADVTKQDIIDAAEAIFTTPCVIYILKPQDCR